MDLKLWWARFKAGNAATSAGQLNVADVATIDTVTGVRPLPVRAAKAAELLGKRLDASIADKQEAARRYAKARREEIDNTVGLDAVNRVKNKVGHA